MRFSDLRLDPDQALQPAAVLFSQNDQFGPHPFWPERIIDMPKASHYSVSECLRDGSTVEIRALRPEDRQDMLAAIDRTSAQSLQRRFFAPKRGFSEQELAFFMNIDFDNHVALVAQIDENGGPVIAGGGRYIVGQQCRAELAFVVVDQYQGKGIATALLRHLIAIAREAGLQQLTAEVLAENAAMLKVFKAFGFHFEPSHDPGVRHLALKLWRT